MKKLFIIFSLLACVLMINAQSTVLNFKSGGANVLSYTGTSADTVSTSESLYKLIDLRASEAPVLYRIYVDVDSASNPAGHLVTLYGSMDKVWYESIAQKTMTANDTVFVFSNEAAFTSTTNIGDSTSVLTQTNPSIYNYLKIDLTGDGAGKSELQSINAKFVELK